MHREDHNLPLDSFLDELSKIALAGRSLLSDFMGGVDKGRQNTTSREQTAR